MPGGSTSTVTAARGPVGTGSLQGGNLTVTLVNGVATFNGLSKVYRACGYRVG